MSQAYPSLVGRSVIVTGGGRGLGRVMALALVGQGARVMITGARSEAELEATRRDAEALGVGECRTMLADVSDAAACEAVVAATIAAFGRVDVLVNNAGLPSYSAAPTPGKPYPFWTADPDGYRRLVETNFVGPFLMARAVTPHMLARGFGKLVNVTTSRPTMMLKGAGPYGPTKAGLEAATLVWAQDLAGAGVTANVLLPGGASDTALIWGEVGGRTDPTFQAGKGPVGKEGDASGGLLPPEVMGPPILWLAADESNGVSGRRVVARDWDADLPPAEAAERAMTPPQRAPAPM